MITYKIAVSANAEELLRVRHSSVVSNNTGKYSQALLEAWSPTVNQETIRAEAEALTHPDRITLVADDKGCIVGLCTLGISEGLLKQCYVLPAYNGQGIARELVYRIEEIARNHGLTSLILSSSLIALDFYKKLGYTEQEHYNYELANGMQMPCVMMNKVITG